MKTILTILALTLSSFGIAQNTYLKISQDYKTSISYPPGTKFELKDSRGYIVLNENASVFTFKIDQAYTLNVFPTYKKEMDTYNLTNGKIELVSNGDYMNNTRHQKDFYQSNGVFLENSIYTDSEANPKETNVFLEFSNGTTFSYEDGKVSATLNGKEVTVMGTYLIYSDSGIIKISYNPKNKELWWTYELK